jgi:endoglucanase
MLRAPSRLLAAVGTAALLAAAGAVAIPSPALADGAEQISNGNFNTGIPPWTSYGVAAGSTRLVDGALCVDAVDGTVNPWNAAIVLSNLPGVTGASYALSFRARASANVTVKSIFQHGSGAFEQAVSGSPAVGDAFQTYRFTGASPLSFQDGQVAFQIGGKGAFTFCVDDVSLLGGDPPKPYEPDTGPRIRVNQVGYLPDGPKAATLVTAATAPLPWQLANASGQVVRAGNSVPRGVDATSGQNVHTIDFSGYRKAGAGYTLRVDGQTSHPFDLSAAAYQRLRQDSKTFFYTNRSGIDILDSIAPGYGRAAGHVGVAPNQGDTAVGCQAPVAFMDNWTCPSTYTRDVTGGWYDAGDHGKYVVNGGISVAQLLGEYERTLYADDTQRGALGDSTLRVPERGNKVPDILDEARWQLEFMLKMQVPAGQPYAGMAYHKVHDNAWTGLPLAPAADNKLRELHRPSTAAALNLAAAAAQGARLFQRYDRAFAARLLTAARTAYAAAKANPALYAPNADGKSGGGPYDDANVQDEFYWAASELFLTTSLPWYAADVLTSPLHRADVFDPNGFYWGSVAALGRLDLATVPNWLPDQHRVRASVLAAADRLLTLQGDQAYGQPYAPVDGKWAWGSTSSILNNLVVIASAYDLTGRERYQRAVLAGVDFLFGRNALNISYVTGYGDVTAQNQHTRMYAHQLNPALPHPPAGTIAGGPNSGIQDPLAQQKLTGCLAQFCYLDDINSWSTNEITTNWNSALSWVASFVADQGNG